mmetsp:Transcript_60382/g.170131  ORF Transcript_60382/g.170131 Transcript_60382/m.170131 type:complete len:227 (-) Transcript_60382:2615-3295(-)
MHARGRPLPGAPRDRQLFRVRPDARHDGLGSCRCRGPLRPARPGIGGKARRRDEGEGGEGEGRRGRRARAGGADEHGEALRGAAAAQLPGLVRPDPPARAEGQGHGPGPPRDRRDGHHAAVPVPVLLGQARGGGHEGAGAGLGERAARCRRRVRQGATGRVHTTPAGLVGARAPGRVRERVGRRHEGGAGPEEEEGPHHGPGLPGDSQVGRPAPLPVRPVLARARE